MASLGYLTPEQMRKRFPGSSFFQEGQTIHFRLGDGNVRPMPAPNRKARRAVKATPQKRPQNPSR
jgi:hypothetical protein